MAQMVKNLPAMWEIQVCTLGQQDPLELLVDNVSDSVFKQKYPTACLPVFSNG